MRGLARLLALLRARRRLGGLLGRLRLVFRLRFGLAVGLVKGAQHALARVVVNRAAGVGRVHRLVDGRKGGVQLVVDGAAGECKLIELLARLERVGGNLADELLGNRGPLALDCGHEHGDEAAERLGRLVSHGVCAFRLHGFESLLGRCVEDSIPGSPLIGTVPAR